MPLAIDCFCNGCAEGASRRPAPCLPPCRSRRQARAMSSTSLSDLHETPRRLGDPKPFVPIRQMPESLNKMDWLFWTQLLAVSEWAIRLTMLPIIVLRKEKPATCLAWLTIIFFEPWIGLGLYLLIGENRLGRRLPIQPPQPGLRLPRVDPHHITDPNDDDYNVLVDLADAGAAAGDGRQLDLLDRHRSGHKPADRRYRRRPATCICCSYLQGRHRGRARGRGVGSGGRARAAPRAGRCGGFAAALRRLALAAATRRGFPVLPANLWRIPFKRLDRKLSQAGGDRRLDRILGSQNIVEASYGHNGRAFGDIMARSRKRGS